MSFNLAEIINHIIGLNESVMRHCKCFTQARTALL